MPLHHYASKYSEVGKGGIRGSYLDAQHSLHGRVHAYLLTAKKVSFNQIKCCSEVLSFYVPDQLSLKVNTAGIWITDDYHYYNTLIHNNCVLYNQSTYCLRHTNPGSQLIKPIQIGLKKNRIL